MSVAENGLALKRSSKCMGEPKRNRGWTVFPANRVPKSNLVPMPIRGQTLLCATNA
ncbi:hypothetical protein HMI51_06110 [Corallococcus coralloides]|nr:hypothetical protein [Corallococcus coralloides]